MAALLVAMSIMAVMLTVAMPVWKQAAQREKEEELIFRGMQYAHAIGMFQRKYANAYPPNFDVLVNEHFLRKKFKDPITNDDFAPVLAGQAPGAPGAAGASGATGPTGRGGPAASTPPVPQRGQLPFGGQVGNQAGRGGFGTTPGQVAGGIIGVTSKSKDKSIRLYNGRSHYNEWQFVWTPQVQAPGAGAPGTGVPGQTGPGRGQNPFAPGGGIGGQRGGRGGNTGPGGRPSGPGGPNRGFNPFQPNPQQPTTPRGGRSGR